MRQAGGIFFLEGAARDLRATFQKEAREADAFLISFPKCGRTWLQLMIAKAFAYRFDLPDETVTYDLLEMRRRAGAGPVILASHDWSEVTSERSEAVDPRLLFSYPFRLRYAGRRVLMLIRDPRDAIVSSFHQNTRRAFRPIDFSQIDAYVLDPLYGFPRVVRFYRIWARAMRLASDIRIVRYEDLVNDGRIVLRPVFEFVGFGDLPETVIDSILDETQLDRMRNLELGAQAGMTIPKEADTAKVRRGRIGGFRDELRAETIAQLDEWMSYIPRPFHYEP